MQYNSISFLFHFLPLFLAVYYIVPIKLKNSVLLLGSVVYYYFAVSSTPWALGMLLGITVAAYVLGRIIGSGRGALAFWPAIIALLGVLIFFKCYDGGKHLPVGLSYYLFQISAYLISVYRGSIRSERNVVRFGSQIMMFPKLLSGPLADPGELMGQTAHRSFSMAEFNAGLQELIVGLALKVMLANRLGGVWAQAVVVGYESISTGFAWLALITYAMKLYFDFHGYSMMACGIARMLGFHLPRNFDSPYASKTVSEFYRRWHITLGMWFRNYVYIPLGGNRKGTGRTILNLLVVWALTGLWHGVGGNYLLWAGILVTFIILERLVLGKFLNKTYVLCHLYTVFVILISWVPFAIGDFGQMTTFMGRLFGLSGQTINAADYVYWLKEYAWLLAAGVILATPLPRKIWERIRGCWLVDLVLFVVFWCCVYLISTSAQDPFAYFQF